MTRPGPDRPKSLVAHESISAPINNKNLGKNSASVWTKPATVIPLPTTNERPQRGFRRHDNPYNRQNNTLPLRCLGNPNVRQTVLGMSHKFGTIPHSHPRKRQKLDDSVNPIVTLNGASSSYTRRATHSGNISESESDVQVIEPPRTTNNRKDPIPNNADTIHVGSSSDDLGERIPRAADSSPDPILLTTVHAFETLPAPRSLPAPNKGKGRVKGPEFVVGDSEISDKIEEFTPPPPVGRPASNISSIPRNIVEERKRLFESAPAAVLHPVEARVDLINRTVVGQMRKKNEGTSHNSDHVGMSSSDFLNSPHRQTELILPLEAWCLGHRRFRHSLSRLDLVYVSAQQKVDVIWGQSPSDSVDFKLGSDVRSAIIVNDINERLDKNVVVQFTTTPGPRWKEVELRFKGFKGEYRDADKLTFLFSTAKDRGFSATNYQIFVTGIKKAMKSSAVESAGPPKGKSIWDFASQYADMLEQAESRKRVEDGGEDQPSVVVQPMTSYSSISANSRTPCPDSKPPDGNLGASIPQRRSARQSANRSNASSPPPQPAVSEPDEVILMYPPTGTGALSIMHSDLRRLQPEEYLNDTLIEFGLKLWLSDLRERDPALADQIHVFSSFFYKKLNNRKNPEDGYKSVRKWTSKVDLFTKKYIIVPINENIHWYLAVIYEPEHTLEPPLPLLHSNLRETRKQKQMQMRVETESETAFVTDPVRAEASLERLHVLQVLDGESETDRSSLVGTRGTPPSRNGDKASCITVESEPVSATSEIRPREISPDLKYPSSDNMDVDTEMADAPSNSIYEVAEVPDRPASMPFSGVPSSQFYGSTSNPGETIFNVVADNEDSGEDQKQEAEVDDMLTVTQSPTGNWPTQTYIFTLDSLGTRHPQAIKVLRQYLTWEAKDKRNFDEVRHAVGKQVQVPVQPNTWDCGIYLLHFVKVFMDAPSEFFERILSTRGSMPSSERKQMWQDHVIPPFRDHLKSRILRLAEEWKSVREGEASKRGNGDVLMMETLTSEGEVDIVEDVPRVKPTPGPRQKQPAKRLR